jgi:hypothetical protein
MSLHILVWWSALVFYFGSRSYSKFEFVLNSNVFANYKSFGNEKRFLVLSCGHGPNPVSTLRLANPSEVWPGLAAIATIRTRRRTPMATVLVLAAPCSLLATPSHPRVSNRLVTLSCAPRAYADPASTRKSWRLQSKETKLWWNQNRIKFLTKLSGSLIRLEMRIRTKSRICTTPFPFKQRPGDP